jgi:hypothetical protein
LVEPGAADARAAFGLKAKVHTCALDGLSNCQNLWMRDLDRAIAAAASLGGPSTKANVVKPSAERGARSLQHSNPGLGLGEHAVNPVVRSS